MPLDARLLEILCCPACRDSVRPLAEGAGVQCVACGRVYPIVSGTLVMLIEDSTLPAP